MAFKGFIFQQLIIYISDKIQVQENLTCKFKHVCYDLCDIVELSPLIWFDRFLCIPP